MPLEAVAKQGDVSASTGSGLPSPATSGTWTAGPVTETPYPFLAVGSVPVIHSASCTFSFSGSDGTSPVTPPPHPVTLTAETTTLQKGSTFVLREGESAEDSYGNMLQVSASGPLRSD